jgi:DNA-binding MurR/RpiR family transcriptional regulator
VGTPLIDDIWWLQLELILLGKRTSAFINPNYQIEAVQNLTHNTLVIGIDVMRQDDIFIHSILKDAKKRGARVACISHFNKASYTGYVDECLFYKGSNSRSDNFVLSLILNYIGKNLREKVIEF